VKRLPLRRINTLLLVAIILINGYILLLPIMPAITYRWENRHGAGVSRLHDKIARHSTGSTDTSQPDELIIPSMLLDQPVNTGKTMAVLRKGLWLRPNGSTPDKGGNTIIVGHRFTYTNPRGTLYHLDKVRAGDEIALFWKGQEHTYKVSEVKVVRATDISIEKATSDDRLTIYTCTPLWLPKDRLVVIAKETME
jgi:LPXTG-site transpeptidase (sortase) family protein